VEDEKGSIISEEKGISNKSAKGEKEVTYVEREKGCNNH
jgi:hypothetical protein